MHDFAVIASRAAALAAKDDVMFRVPRAHPHNSRKQRSYSGGAAPQNPILAWVANDLSRGPEVYLHKLKLQSVALKPELTEAGPGQFGDRLLATVLLKEFATGHGLSISEALCLMPHAAETAGEAVQQLRIWSSAIPAR